MVRLRLLLWRWSHTDFHRRPKYEISLILALVINCINWSRHFLDQSSLDELACLSIASFWIMPDHAWIIMPTADKYWQVNGRINFETWSDPSKVWNLQSVWSPCGLEHNHSMLFALQYANGNFIFLNGKVDWNLWCIKCALLISEIKEWWNSTRPSRN